MSERTKEEFDKRWEEASKCSAGTAWCPGSITPYVNASGACYFCGLKPAARAALPENEPTEKSE